MNKKQPFPDDENFEKTVKTGSLKHDVFRHIMSTLGSDYYPPRKYLYYKGLSYSIRDRLIERWIKTQRSYYDSVAKRVYYLSLEFLPGRFLLNYITNLQMKDECCRMLDDFEFNLEDLEEEEWDAGLGNGGLGRLASCYMDSMATLKIPGYGYGIRYDYGIFFQNIVNGYQVEKADNWLRYGNPWEIKRRKNLYTIKFYGRSQVYTDSKGNLRYRWVDTENIMAVACDILVPGFENDNVINMRLWKAMSSREFNLDYFNQGDYIRALETKVMSENISRVLYPNDEVEHGKELRLKEIYRLLGKIFLTTQQNFPTHTVIYSYQTQGGHPRIALFLPILYYPIHHGSKSALIRWFITEEPGIHSQDVAAWRTITYHLISFHQRQKSIGSTGTIKTRIPQIRFCAIPVIG